MFPNVGLFDIKGCDNDDDGAAGTSVDELCERIPKLLKKFNPNDGLLVGCCWVRVGGSSGDDGRLEPGEFKGGVEFVDLVLVGGCTESLDIVFDEPSGMFFLYVEKVDQC